MAARFDEESRRTEAIAATNAELLANNEELNARFKDLEEQVAVANTERDAAAQVCEDVSRDLIEAQKQIAQEQNQRQELMAKLDEQRKQILGMSKGRTGVPQETVDQLTRERDEAREALAGLEARLAAANEEIARVSRERESLRVAQEAQQLVPPPAPAATQPEAPSIPPMPSGSPLPAYAGAAPLRLMGDPPAAAPVPPIASTPQPPPAPVAPAAAAPVPQPPAAPVIPESVVAPVKPAPQPRRQENSTTIKLEVDPSLLRKIIETAPDSLNGMRRYLHAFIKNQNETSLLEQLLASLHALTEQTAKANLTAVHTMGFALESLLDDLMKIPGQINPSTLRTVSQSLDFLATLLQEKNLAKPKDPHLATIFAVDDDQNARKIIRGAMELVGLKVTCAEDPKTTLAVLNEQRFDLIFIDVGLPEMNGFELCTRLRKLPEHKKTPVVFLTGAVTVQNRVQSSLSGGNDFIAKPFNLLELGVKALTWIFKGQLGMM